MLKVFLYDGDKLSVGGEELINLPLDNNSSIWVDIEAEPVEIEEVIFKQFASHPLTIKDARRLRHPPKTEHFEDQSFVLMRELSSNDSDLAFASEQVAFFIGDNFCEISCTRSNINNFISKLGVHPAYKIFFPKSVDAKRHYIIH